MTKTILTLALLGASTATTAQWPAPVERALSRHYNECMATGDAARGVTVGLMSCSGEEIDRQDARLNQAYRMKMQQLTKPRQARLRTLQRAWIKQRDAGCHREAGREGTAAAMNFSQCILRETIARRLWLERYR